MVSVSCVAAVFSVLPRETIRVCSVDVKLQERTGKLEQRGSPAGGTKAVELGCGQHSLD